MFNAIFLVAAGVAAATLGLLPFVLSGVIITAFEILVLYVLLPRVELRRRRLRLWLAISVLALALVPWAASNPAFAGDPTGFPYHLLWHLTSAAFVSAYFWYLRSEERVAAPAIPS